MEPSCSIARGSVLFFRFLDVAEEFDLDRAVDAIRARGEVRRIELRQESSAALALEALPVEVALGEREVALDAARTLRVTIRVRLFRFGAISVVFSLPITAPTPLASLVPIAAAGWESTDLDAAARAIASELESTLRAVAVGSLDRSPVIERYGIVLAQEIDREPLDDRDALARVLLGEVDPRPLAEVEVEDVLRDRFRYFADDLAIVHTASAFVVEPKGSIDVVLALELACSQLLELRTYDVLIDRELDQVYAALERAKSAGWWLFGLRQRGLSRDAQTRIMELSELADRAESGVKVASDAYLGRIYLSALARMRATAWSESVSRKLGLFARVYDVLKEEAHAHRSLLAEVIIVLLIVFEIVMALRGG